MYPRAEGNRILKKIKMYLKEEEGNRNRVVSLEILRFFDQ